jgi:predicted DNA-binding transcriptional regulator AlpA
MSKKAGSRLASARAREDRVVPGPDGKTVRITGRFSKRARERDDDDRARPQSNPASPRPPPLTEALSSLLADGGERLLGKEEVCARVGRSFPTIWSWMRRGLFPRARIAGRTSVWLESEVNAWMASLPLRAYRDDSETSDGMKI